jgi:hypothetical protein
VTLDEAVGGWTDFEDGNWGVKAETLKSETLKSKIGNRKSEIGNAKGAGMRWRRREGEQLESRKNR